MSQELVDLNVRVHIAVLDDDQSVVQVGRRVAAFQSDVRHGLPLSPEFPDDL